MKRGLLVPAVLLAALAVALLTHRDVARAAWTRLSSVPISAVAGALTLVLCQIGLQASRLWAILPRDVALSLRRVARVFTMGEWVNLFAPARGGDALKVVLLNRASSGAAVSLAKATGAVLADKIVDAGSLVLLCLTSGIAGLIGAEARLRVPPGLALGALVGLTFIWLGVRWVRPAWLERLRAMRRDVALGLAALRDPRRLAASTAFSVGAWMAEVLALCVLCHGIGTPVPYPMMVLALGALNLGVSVPLGAANIGVYEAALAFGLRHAGASLESALAVAALHHLLELAGTNVGAAVLVLTVPRDRC